MLTTAPRDLGHQEIKMAYVTKEVKTRVQKALKGILPKGAKWSLSGTGKSRLALNIWAADEDLIAAVNRHNQKLHGWIVPEKPLTHVDLHHRLQEIDFGNRWNEILEKALEIMNEGNWDRSDIMTDYFDVGWYTEICLGAWDRPFQVLTEKVLEDA